METSEEDKAFIYGQIFSDPVAVVNSTMRRHRPPTMRDAEEFLKMFQTSILGVMVCLRPDGDGGEKSGKPTPIGHMSIFYTSADTTQHRGAMLGITLAAPYRGKGYGGEAINWALDWAFQSAGLHRICISAFSYNTNALKLYRKLGFVDEGLEREAVYYNKSWHDRVMLGMLEQEWEKLRAAQRS